MRGAPLSPGGEDAEKGYRAASLPAAGWSRGAGSPEGNNTGWVGGVFREVRIHGGGGLVLGVGVGDRARREVGVSGER